MSGAIIGAWAIGRGNAEDDGVDTLVGSYNIDNNVYLAEDDAFLRLRFNHHYFQFDPTAAPFSGPNPRILVSWKMAMGTDLSSVGSGANIDYHFGFIQTLLTAGDYGPGNMVRGMTFASDFQGCQLSNHPGAGLPSKIGSPDGQTLRKSVALFHMELDFSATGHIRLYRDGVMATPSIEITGDMTDGGTLANLAGFMIQAGENSFLYVKHIIAWDMNHADFPGIENCANVDVVSLEVDAAGSNNGFAPNTGTVITAQSLPYSASTFMEALVPGVFTGSLDAIDDTRYNRVWGVKHYARVERNGTAAGSNFRFWSASGANDQQGVTIPAPGLGPVREYNQLAYDGALWETKAVAEFNSAEHGYEAFV